MNDIIVSIRMPRSLLLELKDLTESEHYLDLSEQLRSIVRERWLHARSPELYELKKLREDIHQQIRKKSIVKIRQEVNRELERIREQLKKGEILNG